MDVAVDAVVAAVVGVTKTNDGDATGGAVVVDVVVAAAVAFAPWGPGQIRKRPFVAELPVDLR